MNRIFIPTIIVCTFLFSCHNSESQSSDNEQKSEAQKKISKRDQSITAANSYSDLFLDSMAMEKYIADNSLPDSISRRMRSFYNARNYQYAWFSSNGLTEQALGFWNLNSYAIYSGDTSLKNKTLEKKMESLMADTSLQVGTSDKSILNTELSLTEHFIKYMLDNYEKGFVKRKEMERFIPLKKEDAIAVGDSLIAKKHKNEKYYDDVNQSYKLLKEQLIKYLQIAKNGGWQPITVDAKQLKIGTSSPEIAALKRRLQIEGDLAMQDTTPTFDPMLESAIKHFQQRLGYTPDGVVTDNLIKDLNVTAHQRVQQILINLNRMRWMPQEPNGKLILVNIPEFTLHVFDGKTKVFDMAVVVGKEGHNTMMFTGKLSEIIFNPYWNVPPSIVQREIMPKMESDPNYLTEQNMEVTGNEGGVPEVRQLPGDKNSLGRVKFLFPNSYDIYFHDTPAKDLFKKDKRAYSHGCIRLSDPEKMADYLLKDNPAWPPEKISATLHSPNTETIEVNIKDPVPVFITYYTAWVNENGELNFRDDIYGRDLSVAKKMF